MDRMQENLGQDASVGQRLRRTREAQNLTLDDVAMQTRIPIRHLRNIEDSNWSELPAGTYTVGFARSYANAIGMDGAEVGRELREQLGGGKPVQQMSPVYYNPPDPARVPSRPLAWIAGAVAILLVVGYLWWRSRLGDDDTPTAEPAPQEQQATPGPATTPVQQAAPQNLAGQQVTLVATGTVWFRVSDKAGNRRLGDKTLEAQGQYQVPLDAQQPVIQTGRPQVLRVMVGGRDLGPLAPQERRISDVSLLAADLANRLGQQAQPAPGQPAQAAQPAQPTR
jgi:hypothetical protein